MFFRQMLLSSLCAFFLIACIGPSKEDVPRLITELRHSDSSVRNRAAMQLGSIGEDAEKAVPALRKALNDVNGGVQTSAAFALRKIGTPAAERALNSYRK